MSQGKWARLSPTQRADIWIRWQADLRGLPFGQIVPGSTGAQNPENAVEHCSRIAPRPTATAGKAERGGCSGILKGYDQSGSWRTES